MTGVGIRAARWLASAVMVLGLGVLGWALRPADGAPVPAATFDTRAAQPGPEPTRAAARHRWVADPVRLAIPSLQVDAPVRPEKVDADGALVIPGDPSEVGSWATGRDPSLGTLVLAGHVDMDGDLGALHPLSRVRPGTQIVLRGGDGARQTWRVTATEVRRKDDLPTFPRRGRRQLALVTCAGPVVDTGHGRGYRDNLVVWAEPLD